MSAEHRADSKQDLLLGLLAINQGLLHGPQLAELLSECTRTECGLPKLLTDRGLLSANEIESLQEARSFFSEGDWQRVLPELLCNRETIVNKSDLEVAPTIIEDPHKMVTADLETMLETEGTESKPESKRSSARDRFRAVKHLSRGGLGIVTVAVDHELNREVAVKQIHVEKAHIDVYRKKFLREAEITGNLEHPGVVPVYGMGTDSSGQLYYAMQLIRGETLYSLLRRHWNNHERDQQAFYQPSMIALLDHFLAVCQTIGYAHRRQVIHRDLKPENVMVGAYGETIVVDWGLAKIIGEDDPDFDEATEAGVPQLNAPAEVTREGAGMGTPAYGAPEQLEGRTGDVDFRSDIYGLGAILYEILSGRAPVVGTSGSMVKQKAIEGRVDDLRWVAPYVPTPLAAVCMKCLAHDPNSRYASVRELIDDVHSWKADQPVTARTDTKVERISRWLRHHRNVSRGVLAVIATATVISIIAGTRIHRQNTELAGAYQEQQRLTESESEQRESAQAVRDLLVSVFRSPDPQFDGLSMTANDLLKYAESVLADNDQIDQLHKAEMYLAIGKSYVGMGQYENALHLLTAADRIFQTHSKHSARDRARLQIAMAEAYRGVGNLSRSSQTINEALAEMEPDTLEPPLRRELMFQLAETRLRAGENKEAQSIFENLKPGLNDTDALRIAEGIGRCELQQGQYAEAEATLRKVYEDSLAHGTIGIADATRRAVKLAEASIRLDKPQDALQRYDEVLKLQLRHFGETHPETLITRSNRAFALRRLGRYDESAEAFGQLLELWIERLGSGHPDVLVAENNYAESLIVSGRYTEASERFESIVAAMQERYADPNHAEILFARHNLANALFWRGLFDQAIEIQREIFAVRNQELGSTHSETMRAGAELASSLIKSGNVKEATRILQQQLEYCQEQLGDEHSTTLLTKLNLATIQSSDPTQINQAIPQLEGTIVQMRGILGPNHRWTLVATLNLVRAYETINWLPSGIELLEKLIPQWEAHLGPSHPQMLEAQRDLTRLLTSMSQFDRAREVLQQLIPRQEERFGTESVQAIEGLIELGRIYGKSQLPEKEIETLESAQDRLAGNENTNDPQSRFKEVRNIVLDDLAAAYLRNQQGRKAISLLKRIVDYGNVNGEDALWESKYNLAIAHIRQREYPPAIELLESRQQALKDASLRKQFEGLVWLGVAYHNTNNYQKAIEVLSQAKEMSIEVCQGTWLEAWAKTTLAESLAKSQAKDEAIELLEESREILSGQLEQLPIEHADLPNRVIRLLDDLGEGNTDEERKLEQDDTSTSGTRSVQ